MPEVRMCINGVESLGVIKEEFNSKSIIPSKYRVIINLTSIPTLLSPSQQDIVDNSLLSFAVGFNNLIYDGPEMPLTCGDVNCAAARYASELDICGFAADLTDEILNAARLHRKDNTVNIVAIAVNDEMCIPAAFMLNEMATNGIPVLYPVMSSESLPLAEDIIQNREIPTTITGGEVRHFINMTNCDYTMQKVYNYKRGDDNGKDRK